MAYNLFSRTSKPTTGLKKKDLDVLGNPLNNASAGFKHPRKPDGLLNKIHPQNQFDWPNPNFEGAEAFPLSGFVDGQIHGDFNFYQASPAFRQVSPLNDLDDAYDVADPRHYNSGYRNGVDHYGNGNGYHLIDKKPTNRHTGRWQADRYYSPAKSRQAIHTSPWQPYINKRDEHKIIRHEAIPNNLEFKYRRKTDGRLLVDSQMPLTYSKNMIPDISAFSRSEASIQILKRKRSVSNSDFEAEISDDRSEDIGNQKRLRSHKIIRNHRRTKSRDDAEFSELANIKIEGLIQRKLGFKVQEKKSEGMGMIDRVSNGNSSMQVLQATVKKDEDSHAKLLLQEKVTNNKRTGNNLKDKQAEGVSYNKEELTATLRALVRSGGLDESKVETFDKFDEDLGKVVKYVRIDLSHIANFNDHIISIKPLDLGAKNKAAHCKNFDVSHQPQGKRPGHSRMQAPHQMNQGHGIHPALDYYQDTMAGMDEGKMTVVEQAMHKRLTGKLQRSIKAMTDEEKVALFRQLKGSLHELATNQQGRYVLVLFLKSNVTAIVDALVSYFDKRIMDLITHKHGLLFSQSIIDLRFRDVRLRRSLKRIDQNLAFLMADDHAPHVILIYVSQLSSADLGAFVDYCKHEYRMCLDNPVACKVFARVFGKVSDVDRLEIELNLKSILPQIFDRGGGRELVEVFFSKADPQNQISLRKKVFENLPKYLTHEDYEYFFSKVAELKKTELIDALLTKCFADQSVHDADLLAILNNTTGYKTILSFFTLASMPAKDLMRVKLNELRQTHAAAFNFCGQKVVNLCDSYFYAPSK